MPNLTYRVLHPTNAAASPLTAHGRSYTPNATYVDVPFHDAQVLAGNGWKIFGRVGTTANRPLPGVAELHGVKPGESYIDTTLGKVVVWDGIAWRDPLTGAVA